MARSIFTFDPPERFVAGTVGQPGERTFFLQARGGGAVTSVALEKVQVSVLAEKVGELLDEVRRRGGDVPAVAAPGSEDVAPLDQPILEEFRVGTMRLAWDGEDDVVIIEALAQTGTEGDDENEEDEDAEDDGTADDTEDDLAGPDMLRVRIDAASARAFVQRAQRVVAAGRPPCPLCGLPLDPEGHVCPRQNGHRH
ncbi:MAG TPA: DUF3090 domain-containing protein [Mycobacteriales bacterium]|nr:DUF3090 domain-containing protein [Mycobacteriales bacterium]